MKTLRSLLAKLSQINWSEVPFIGWLLSIKWEASMVLVAYVIFYHLGTIFRWWDSTASPLDLGTLSFVWVGVFGVVSAILLFWVIWRVALPKSIDDWFDRKLPEKASPVESEKTDEEEPVRLEVPLEESSSFLSDWFNSPPYVRILCFFGTLWAVIYGVSSITVALK